MYQVDLEAQEQLFNDFLIGYHQMQEAKKAAQAETAEDTDDGEDTLDKPAEDKKEQEQAEPEKTEPEPAPQGSDPQKAIDETLTLFDAQPEKKTAEEQAQGEHETRIIQDFGKKIGGARKDLYGLYRQSLFDAEKIEKPSTLTQGWPVPDYLKLLASDVPAWKVSAIRALRDSLPNKAVKGWDMSWRDGVKAKRTIALGILRDEYTEESFLAELERMTDQQNYPRVERHVDKDSYNQYDSYNDMSYNYESYTRVKSLYGMYQHIGHENDLSEYFAVSNKTLHFTRNGRYVTDEGHYTLTKQFKSKDNQWEKKEDGSHRFVFTINWRGTPLRQHRFGVILKNALPDDFYRALAEDVAAHAETKAKKTSTRGKKDASLNFEVHYTLDENGKPLYTLYALDKNSLIDLKDGFTTWDEAYNYGRDHEDELLPVFKKRIKCPFERNDTNEPRMEGDQVTELKDVTPEDYSKTFGFYADTNGVEFGNWVEGKRRQENLNESMQALKDLASVLQVPESALTLNSTLSLRFGSNGHGGIHAPMAHYEPSRKAINLTKKNGAGCLAHEWFHALDNYLMGSDPTTYLSNCAADRFWGKREAENANVRPALFDKLMDVWKTIESTDTFMKRCRDMDKHRRKPYWATTIEIMARCFETYVREKLAEKGIRNDFLVNIKGYDQWLKEADKSFPFPYPMKEELPPITKAFDALFAEMKYKTQEGEHTTTKLYSCDDYETVAGRTMLASVVSYAELTEAEKNLRTFSQLAMGMDVRFVTDDPSLHGLYDKDSDMIYLNRESNKDLTWTLCHEAFHAMRYEEPALYADLLSHAEGAEAFTTAQLNAYREKHRAYDLPDDTIKEELLADAFAKQKTQAHALCQMTEQDEKLTTRVMNFLKRTAHKAVAFFKEAEPEEGLTAKQAVAFSERLDYLTENLTIDGHKPLSKGEQILGIGNLPVVATDVLPSCKITPFTEQPAHVRAFDIHMACEFMKKYPIELISEVLHSQSARGHEKGYVDGVMREAQSRLRVCARA